MATSKTRPRARAVSHSRPPPNQIAHGQREQTQRLPALLDDIGGQVDRLDLPGRLVIELQHRGHRRVSFHLRHRLWRSLSLRGPSRLGGWVCAEIGRRGGLVVGVLKVISAQNYGPAGPAADPSRRGSDEIVQDIDMYSTVEDLVRLLPLSLV